VRISNVLAQFGLLMIFQFLGEALVTLSGVPFPGPLCGMALLLSYLFWRGGPTEELAKVGTALVDNLGLLFVPAGVGIIGYAHLLAQDGLAIAAALVVSTIAGILVTGVIAVKGVSAATISERAA